MRYYALTITDKNGKVVPMAAMGKSSPDVSLTTHVKGANGERYIPSAPQLDFDLNMAPGDLPVAHADSWIRIFGPTLTEISQIKDWFGYGIELAGGFKKGLPLVKPEQAGVLVTGFVNQPYGNWVMNEMMLEFYITPSSPAVGAEAKTNFVLSWKANTSLKDALIATFDNAYKPRVRYDIKISDDLKFDHDETGTFDTFYDLAKKVRELTNHPKFKGITTLNKSEYAGVQMLAPIGGVITVFDNTKELVGTGNGSSSAPIEIKFNELMGQPTWVGPFQISFTVPLRYDVRPGMYIKLPEKLKVPFVITRPEAAFPGVDSRDQSAFSGQFLVQVVRHVGQSRSGNALAWATTITCLSQNWKYKDSKKIEPAKPKEASPQQFEGTPVITPATGHPPGLFPSGHQL